MSAPEVLAALSLVALSLGATLPALSDSYRSWKLTAAARDVASEMHRVRMEAIAQGLHAGLLFERSPGGSRWRPYGDGGRPGIYASEIASGTDLPAGPAIEIASRHPGVRFGIAGSGTVPRIPPDAGVLAPGSDPIAFGNSDIYSASPTGGTSGGTLYLTDGANMRAVVAYGPTGRIRVWRYDAARGFWDLR